MSPNKCTSPHSVTYHQTLLSLLFAEHDRDSECGGCFKSGLFGRVAQPLGVSIHSKLSFLPLSSYLQLQVKPHLSKELVTSFDESKVLGELRTYVRIILS